MARSLALAGILTIWLAGCGPAPEPLHPSLDPRNAKVDPSKIHPVTREMREEADTMAAKRLPEFSLESSREGRVKTADLVGAASILYFINLECPCCVDMNPVFNELSVAAPAARVIGIADGPIEKVREWVKANEPKYEVLADAKESLMRTLKIRNGVYFALISPNGEISRIEPGVSREVMAKTLTDLNTGGKADWRKAPERLTSGCAFSWTE